MKKCELCSTKSKSTYHYGKCPLEQEESEIFFKLPRKERPIEFADRYLRLSGMERNGAKGWI